MKIFLSLFLSMFSMNLLFSQDVSSLYQLSFPSIESGQTIDMVTYQGKKVIVAVCSTKEPDLGLLRGLDSLLQNNKDKLAIIVVPVSDFNKSTAGKSIKGQWNISRANYNIAAESTGRKLNGATQHPLLRWVTDVSQNKHFQHDVKESGDLFVISETGRLFAVLKQGGIKNRAVLENILTLNIPNK